MAVFGRLQTVKQQVIPDKFKKAFEYLEKVLEDGCAENKRLLSLAMNAFEKVELDENNFALEQVYRTKNRKECFFESHRRYIDVQFILEGEEIIEVNNVSNLEISVAYNDAMDLIKYKTISASSILKLQKGDVAIFYPEDAHMPCVKLNDVKKIIKTVVKVAI